VDAARAARAAQAAAAARSAMSRALALALALALCAARAVAQVYSPLLPGFLCARQDAACAALGDLYAATTGAQWRNNSGWLDAAGGTPTDYCIMAGVTCTAGNITRMCAQRQRRRQPSRCGVACPHAPCPPMGSPLMFALRPTRVPQLSPGAAAARHVAGLVGRHHVAREIVRARRAARRAGWPSRDARARRCAPPWRLPALRRAARSLCAAVRAPLARADAPPAARGARPAATRRTARSRAGWTTRSCRPSRCWSRAPFRTAGPR
jgi:hypothetical protein